MLCLWKSVTFSFILIRYQLIKLKREGKIGENKRKDFDYNELIDGEDGEQSEVSQSDEVSSASSTDQAAVKMLSSLAKKGSSVAAEYESKIKAKMISEKQGGDSVDAEVEDGEDDEEKSDRDLEKAVAEALRKKRAQQKEAISDGSIGGQTMQLC